MKQSRLELPPVRVLNPEEVDQYGFPLSWRNTPPNETNLERSVEDWPTFEQWCAARGVRAFPASRETVLDFLRDPPVQGRALYDTWWAIQQRHEAYYWHSDANPYDGLRSQVQVSEDGSVTIDPTVMTFGLGNYLFAGRFLDPNYLEAREGLYVVWNLVFVDAGGYWRVLEADYAENVREAVLTSKYQECWQATRRGLLYFSASYRTKEFIPSVTEFLQRVEEQQARIPCRDHS